MEYQINDSLIVWQEDIPIFGPMDLDGWNYDAYLTSVLYEPKKRICVHGRWFDIIPLK